MRGLERRLAAAFLALALPSVALAAPGDTTWVRTFDQDFYNWATPHYQAFTLPADVTPYSKIVCFYTIECPGAPNDCDPWDRLGHLRVVTPQGDVEIMRIITPYDITGSGRPGSCTWKYNVTSYKSLLHGEVELRNYIESWIGGDDGWIVTVDLAYIEGTRELEPYRVVNLWGNDHVVYGDPAQPVADALPSAFVHIPADVDEVKFRVFTTGHGQGNTDNCAEFCPKIHSVVADATVFQHTLWRNNCALNPCSPQGGNWAPNRAGWCPGDDAPAWTLDITSALTPGQMAEISYEIEDYENFCRPTNPQCVDGQTCPDCDYNSTGHTTPHWTVQGQLVFWKAAENVVGVSNPVREVDGGVELRQNEPNPFDGSTRIRYSIPSAGPVEITIHDPAGRLVRMIERSHGQAGEYDVPWDGTDGEGNRVAAGSYFYRIRAAGETRAKTMILLK